MFRVFRSLGMFGLIIALAAYSAVIFFFGGAIHLWATCLLLPIILYLRNQIVPGQKTSIQRVVQEQILLIIVLTLPLMVLAFRLPFVQWLESEWIEGYASISLCSLDQDLYVLILTPLICIYFIAFELFRPIPLFGKRWLSVISTCTIMLFWVGLIHYGQAIVSTPFSNGSMLINGREVGAINFLRGAYAQYLPGTTDYISRFYCGAQNQVGLF